MLLDFAIINDFDWFEKERKKKPEPNQLTM